MKPRERAENIKELAERTIRYLALQRLKEAVDALDLISQEAEKLAREFSE